MTEDKVEDSLSRSLTETYLDQISVDSDILAEALRVDGEAMTNLTSKKLSAMSFNLARYQVFLQLHANVRVANHLKAKRDFKIELGKTLVGLKEKVTIAEKTAIALEQNKQLAALEKELAYAEREEALFKDIPRQSIELINSMKKELTRRERSG